MPRNLKRIKSKPRATNLSTNPSSWPGTFYPKGLPGFLKREKEYSMEPSWIEHFDMVQALLVMLIGIIGWFIVRNLKAIDKNQTLLFERQEHLERKFYTLLGEHRAKHNCGKGD